MANLIAARTAACQAPSRYRPLLLFLPQRQTAFLIFSRSQQVFSLFIPLRTLKQKALDGLSTFTALALFTVAGSDQAQISVDSCNCSSQLCEEVSHTYNVDELSSVPILLLLAAGAN